MEGIKKKKCLRCPHEWYPRTPKEPVICPKCKSPYWNVPRKIKKDK
jgi:hypothetical protein